MAIIKCKMCGGDLILIEGATTAECEYCGSLQTVPTADNEKKLTLFARANRLRAACEFDKAAGIYENIVADFPEEAEAYWGLVLCKYGIEYVDDPGTGKKIPTCHRSSFDSVMDDENFEQACENADMVAKKVYRDEAKQIEEIRKGILEVSSSEKPYDVFICYKETDAHGDRTVDSLVAQDIYDALTAKGYRTFFSRITLEDKLGQAYEPYIFAALNSAKVMLAVGTCYEHYDAVWVKNEWSRYLKIAAKDKNRYLIPCYKGIDAYDIPKEFAHLQGQDMGKVGAIADLIRGVEKLVPIQVTTQQAAVQQVVVQQTASAPGLTSLYERGTMYLEDQNWESADSYFEKTLDIDPKFAPAYIGKMCVELKLTSEALLAQMDGELKDNAYFQKGLRFADDQYKTVLEGYIDTIAQRKNEKVYLEATNLLKNATYRCDYKKVLSKLEPIQGYKDVDYIIQQCHARIDEIESVNKSNRELYRDERLNYFMQSHQLFDTSSSHSVMINEDASVRSTVYKGAKENVYPDGRKRQLDFGQCNVEKMADIISVFATQSTTVGIKSDGTITCVGKEDIVTKIDGAKNAIGTVGCGMYVDGDGCIINPPEEYPETGDWQNIKSVCFVSSESADSENSVRKGIAGVSFDGSVLVAGDIIDSLKFELKSWTSINKIVQTSYAILGIKKDGRVLCLPHLRKSLGWKSDFTAEAQANINNITEVADIQSGIYFIKDSVTGGIQTKEMAVLLKKDGSVFSDICNVTDSSKALMNNIYKVIAGIDVIWGLTQTGKVKCLPLSAEVHISDYDEDKKQLFQMIQGKVPAEFTQWEDVIDLFATSNIIALKKDGVLSTFGRDNYGKLDVSGWKVPVHKSEKYIKRIEQMELAKEKELASAKERYAAEEARLAEERAAAIERKIQRLKKERAALKAELPTVTGLFAGKRRREIEDRLDAIRQELRRLNPDR